MALERRDFIKRIGGLFGGFVAVKNLPSDLPPDLPIEKLPKTPDVDKDFSLTHNTQMGSGTGFVNTPCCSG